MNIRILILAFIPFAFSLSAYAQSGIDGRWNTGRGGFVEIYDCGGKLCGKLVASEEPDRIDKNNPDPTKSKEKLIGHNILRNFVKTGDHVWKKGKIYNPNSGKSYSAKLTLAGDVLKVRGYKGVSLFGKTVEWTRQK